LHTLDLPKECKKLATPLERLEGKYEILDKIKEGGMGSVYKVRHRLLDEVRVVKVMRPHLADDEILKARFLQEAKIAIKLRHPNLAQIYDFTMDDNGYAYLVMEFIDGLDLQEMVKILGRPPLGLVLEVAAQSLGALGYLHRKRIIHRDVSPDNLLVARDDERALQVKLIDLGIAKVHHEGEESLTSAGTFLGKVRYSSPEHFKSHEGADVSGVSDLYSFGVVLYELLTGVYPIHGSSVASLISGHLVHPPLDFSESDPGGAVPDDLRAIALKALEKNPDDRYQSAREMSEALAPYSAEHSVEEDQLRAIFEGPALTTRKIKTVKPGSTQSRMDRSFGISTTPAPSEISDVDDDIETSGTVETGGVVDPSAEDGGAAKPSQVRALLVGAGKLIETQNYDEARLQLASILEFEPDNAEGRALVKAIDAVDEKMRRRRQEAADGVRAAITADELDFAASKLEKAIQAHGEAEIFDEVRDELETAKNALAERELRVAEIEKDSEKLIADGEFESAVSLIREGLDLEPNHHKLKTQLKVAESGLAAEAEVRRRQREIDDTAHSINDHIDNDQVTEAEQALVLAVKLYGREEVFNELDQKLEELRQRILLERVEALHAAARNQMEDDDFKAAIATLNEARELVGDADSTAELLEKANYGLRLQEEAANRQRMIHDITLRVERLIVAGRLVAAVQAVEASSGELDDCEEMKELRDRIEHEMTTRGDFEARAETALERALDHAAKQDFADAEDALGEAQAIVVDLPEIADVVREAEAEIHRRIEAHRHLMAIEKVVQSIERQLEKNAPDEARRELGLARRLYGESDPLDDLGAKIDMLERELRRQQIDKLIEKALRKRRRFDVMITDLQSAAELDPGNEMVRQLLVEARAAQQKVVDDRRSREHGAALAAIDVLIADGEPGKALESLAVLTAEVGEFREARELCLRLEACIDQQK
jgi:serine/threonine protein kinase